ncbi:hypothetical protein FEM33_20250 [Dyadobacter flavalbus]|uniref:Uncharacterized protein n=1 Tax=Dyadobacter flavalbus TaxID=2579942 RepID=A0A5M8QLN6_9BACT|nr:hypothetical protein [Dyadobacter flavalbus]KAA6437055.1 hypothetical protein FEM33_20250 [Dyadobacter flavalbus]
MEMTSYIVIGIAVTVLTFFVQKYFMYLSRGVFEIESQKIMNFLFFRSFGWFRYSFPGFNILVNVFVVYSLLNISANWVTICFSAGLFCCSIILSYKLHLVISADKDFFLFYKYSSSIRYYNSLTEAERREVYGVVLRRLSKLDIRHLGQGGLVDFFQENYIARLGLAISFERFDYWLENSESRHYTGTLFYSKFRKNIYSELREIQLLNEAVDLHDYHLSLLVSTLLKPSSIKFDDNFGLHYESSLVSDQFSKIVALNRQESASKILDDRLCEIERRLQSIAQNSNRALKISDVKEYVENSVKTNQSNQDLTIFVERLDEILEDIRMIKLNSATEENLVELNRSISDLINEPSRRQNFATAEELRKVEAGISNLLEGKLDVLAQKNDKIEKLLYTLTPRIICEIDECKKENISEYLITQLESDKIVVLKSNNISDIRKLVNDHFVEKGSKKYNMPTGPYKDEEFFKNNRDSIYTAFAALSNEFKSITKTKLAEILFHALPNSFNSEKTIKNGLSKWDNKNH